MLGERVVFAGLHKCNVIKAEVILIMIPANTIHLYYICTMLVQRRRRWADVVQMLYKCFVFAGMVIVIPFAMFLSYIVYMHKCEKISFIF